MLDTLRDAQVHQAESRVQIFHRDTVQRALVDVKVIRDQLDIVLDRGSVEQLLEPLDEGNHLNDVELLVEADFLPDSVGAVLLPQRSHQHRLDPRREVRLRSMRLSVVFWVVERRSHDLRMERDQLGVVVDLLGTRARGVCVALQRVQLIDLDRLGA